MEKHSVYLPDLERYENKIKSKSTVNVSILESSTKLGAQRRIDNKAATPSTSVRYRSAKIPITEHHESSITQLMADERNIAPGTSIALEENQVGTAKRIASDINWANIQSALASVSNNSHASLLQNKKSSSKTSTNIKTRSKNLDVEIIDVVDGEIECLDELKPDDVKILVENLDSLNDSQRARLAQYIDPKK